MSAGGVVVDTAIAREENGEFCVTVGAVARTASILAQSVKGAGC